MKNEVFGDIKTQFIPHRKHYIEVFTAVTMKNVAFWDIKLQFIPHRKHITYPAQNPACQRYVRFEIFMAVTMKIAVFSDIKPCLYLTGNTLLLQHRTSLLVICKT
jgi:hypothetical protein